MNVIVKHTRTYEPIISFNKTPSLDSDTYDTRSQEYRRSTGRSWVKVKSGRWKLLPNAYSNTGVYLGDSRTREFWEDAEWVKEFDRKKALKEEVRAITDAMAPPVASSQPKRGRL